MGRVTCFIKMKLENASMSEPAANRGAISRDRQIDADAKAAITRQVTFSEINPAEFAAPHRSMIENKNGVPIGDSGLAPSSRNG